MTRHPERGEAASVKAALAALGVAAGARAALAPADLDAGELGVVAGAEAPVGLVIVDADRSDAATVLADLGPHLAGGALVVVRARVRGDGIFGGLRGRRELEDVVRPLLSLPVLALGVVEVRGLFGATLAWARLRPDAPAWIER